MVVTKVLCSQFFLDAFSLWVVVLFLRVVLVYLLWNGDGRTVRSLAVSTRLSRVSVLICGCCTAAAAAAATAVDRHGPGIG